MTQQRSIVTRCLLASLITLGGLFAVNRLTQVASAQPVTVGEQSTLITSTNPIDLLPDLDSFLDTGVSLPGVQNGSASWGDCNNDGASDILLTGQVSPTLRIARVYQQQTDGSFTLTAVLSDVINGAAAWGDFDNDGWLDIALTGENAGVPLTRLYRNAQNNCTFSATAASLIGVRHSVVAWGDYDADGQIDLLVAGDNGSQPVTKLYRNTHGAFSDSGLILPGIQDGAAAWGDYNNDGLADLLLTGSTPGGGLTKLYRSDGFGGLIEVSTALPALSDSAAAWGDYDNDGRLDLLLEGTTDAPLNANVAEVYRNIQGVSFTNTAHFTGGLTWAGAAWGDYDTDGYLDALISSDSNAKTFRNDQSGSFTATAGIPVGPAVLDGTAAWGHYDVLNNLDVLLTGRSTNGSIAKVYAYSQMAISAPPDPPQYLTATVVGSSVVLRWQSSSGDDHTPVNGLSYNLRVGTQPGGVDIVAPMANSVGGKRQLPALGNAYQARAITLTNLPRGKTLYWSVQAIDTSYLGSAFAVEGSFQIPYRVHLPIVLKDYIAYYLNEWETEPNNNYLISNGPLKSGQIYRGVHNDEKDYYSVYLPAGGTLNIDMISPNGGTQLQLFYQIADVAHRVGSDTVAPYHIGYTGAAGWYYIYVYTNPAFTGTDTYTLTVTYP